MFVKPLSKYNKTTKARYHIYQLCESYRLDGRARQRIISGLGKLEGLPTDGQKMLLGKRIEEKLKGENRFAFEPVDMEVEKLAAHFCQAIKKKRRYDVKDNGSDWQTVNMDTLENKGAREIGAVVALQTGVRPVGHRSASAR